MTKLVKAIFTETFPDISPLLLEEYFDILKKDEITEKLSHKHHILPKCLFPKYSLFSKYPWNKRIISITTHIKAHEKLCALFPNHGGLFYALYKLQACYKNTSENNLKELRQKMKTLKWINNGKIQLRVFETELQEYLSNNWVAGCLHMKRSCAYITDGNIDKRVNSSELSYYLSLGWSIGRSSLKGKESKSRGKIFICKENESKMILSSDLDYWLSLGWNKGQHIKNKQICIFKETETKKINREEVSTYLELGWSKGNPNTYLHHVKGIKRCWIFNKSLNKLKFIRLEELNTYVALGWIKGRPDQKEISFIGGSHNKGISKKPGLIWIHNDEKETRIQKKLLPEYLKIGWKSGRSPK